MLSREIWKVTHPYVFQSPQIALAFATRAIFMSCLKTQQECFIGLKTRGDSLSSQNGPLNALIREENSKVSVSQATKIGGEK